jgi:hypothetical protein
MFIKIVQSDEPFEWTPVDEKTGTKYSSTFTLRIVTDDVEKEIRKKYTTKWWDKGRRVEEFDSLSHVIAVLDYAIVSWRGVQGAEDDQDLPCTSALKAKLPEKWRTEIVRLCSGKEAGDVVSQAAQEKKPSKPI